MKLRKAVKYVALSACVAVPGTALAIGGSQGDLSDTSGCQELISDGSFAQYRCGDFFVQDLGTGGSMTAVSAVGAGEGVTHADSMGPGSFAINTGIFAFTDNTGADTVDGAGFDANLRIEQSVGLGGDARSFFKHVEGPAADDGHDTMTAFFQRMNDPDGDGTRYAPDARFMTLSGADGSERHLDLSAPDSRLHFRLQQSQTFDSEGLLLEDNELLRFGQNRTDGSFAHFFAYAELNGQGGELLTPADMTNVPGTGGQSRHDGLVANWVAAIEGGGGDLTGVEDMFFDFRSDEFFHNTTYILADGDGGVLNPTTATAATDTTGLAFGEEVNNPNYAGPFQAGASGVSGLQ